MKNKIIKSISLITIIILILLILKPKQILIIAHRGASGTAPENTLKAFKKALSTNADMIELDVYKTKDNRLVVIHDNTLERTTNGQGFVENHTLAQLQKLNAGENEIIPTLEQVINLVDRKIPINIELKGSNTAEPVALLLKEYLQKGWRSKDFLISSFDHQLLNQFHQFLPQIALGKLIEFKLPEDIFKNLDGIIFIGLDLESINLDMLEAIHKNKLKVFVYTVNTKADFIKLKKTFGKYLDGIFTNYPNIF